MERLSEQGGAFEIHRYAGEAAARAAIEGRQVYGAVVASPEGTTVLTASGAPATAGPGVTARRPRRPAGSRGHRLRVVVLPLVLASVIAGDGLVLGRAIPVQALALPGRP